MIVCFGDSLTAGYGTEAGQSYPDYLQADLDALGYKYRVVNEGSAPRADWLFAHDHRLGGALLQFVRLNK